MSRQPKNQIFQTPRIFDDTVSAADFLNNTCLRTYSKPWDLTVLHYKVYEERLVCGDLVTYSKPLCEIRDGTFRAKLWITTI